jgi:hypothetical protein
MKQIKFKTQLIAKFILILLIFSCFVFLLNETVNKDSSLSSDENSGSLLVDGEEKPRSAVVISKSYNNIAWLDNPNFNGISPWINITEGDSSDINATYSEGVANYEVMGNSGKFELIVDPTNATEMAKWTASKKSEYEIYPDIHAKTNEGFYSSHYWDEGAAGGSDNNTGSVRWVRQIEMPVNMSDYKITSASVKAQFNATVEEESDDTVFVPPWNDDYGGIEVPGDRTRPGQDDTWDYAYFSVEISSEDNPQMKSLLAYNRTNQLGEDHAPPYDDNVPATIPDTDMTLNLEENLLISALESALSYDDYNFTVYLGIDVLCSDNWIGVDIDNFTSLIIRSLNLTFTYEKIMNYGSALAWQQIGNMINHTSEQYYSSTVINDVQMNFDYKINESWVNQAPNSEIQIFINNKEQKIYPHIKLTDYNGGGNFITAKAENYDFTSLVNDQENISLAIKVALLDFNFWLDHRINISIDNIYFIVSYTVFFNFPPPAADDDDDKTKTTILEEPWFNLLIAIAAITGAICLGGYLVYYIRVLKYPKPVRSVRKYRRTLKRKKMPSVDITSREKAFNSIFREFSAISLLKGKPIEEKPSAKKINKSPKKLPK